MFRKDFKSKGYTQVKSSDRKKLRQQFHQTYPTITDDILSSIIPIGKGDDFTSCKLLLHTGDDCFVYSTNKIPWFFILDDQTTKIERILPTVYLLWKSPDLIPLKFHTNKHVFTKLLNGADLMLPGLILPSGCVTPQTFRHVKRDQLCTICLDDNRYPIAIGQTAMDGDDMYMSGMKGRGIVPLHLYQDTLWSIGPRSEVPYENEQRQLFVMDGDVNEENNVEQACAQITDECNDFNLNEQLTTVTISSESTDENPPESMDEILDTIFFYLCQRKAKSFDLPLLASHLFVIMQDCVPGLTLDLKLSSHKKFSKFLQYQHEINQLITLEEIKPGVLAITSFNTNDNEHLHHFRTPAWLKISLTKMSDTIEIESKAISSNYTFPAITELWKSNARVNEILACSTSTHYFRADEIRQAVRTYVIRNKLNHDKQVQLNDKLSSLVFTNNQQTNFVHWNELNTAVFDAMSPCTELVFNYLQQPIRINGHIQPIELECIDRNRKRQTFVKHLDTYQIDFNDLCKRIRQGASVSAVINDADDGKRTGRTIMAQGNQISFIIRLLKDEYGVPNKFIRET